MAGALSSGVRGAGIVLIVVAALNLWVLASSRAGDEPQAAADAVRALQGAIDIHVHSLPDERPRSVDAIEVATLARDRGMRAIVLKNHYESTAGLAYLVRKLVPGIEVFGGIDLNLTVGGINVAAVEHMSRVSGGWGRVVWMPTFDAENQVRVSNEKRPSVPVVRSGAILPEVAQVIAVIAKHGFVLATGHSSPSEALLILREGKARGVRSMVVTHAMNPPVSMGASDMLEATRLGALIEFVGGSLAGADAEARVAGMAALIRRVGPASVVLSSDLGQVGNPLPPDGFGDFLVRLGRHGFTPPEVDRMARENPARLLGLP